MNAYCDKRDRDIVYFEFLLNGDRIKGEQTPNEVFFSRPSLLDQIHFYTKKIDM